MAEIVAPSAAFTFHVHSPSTIAGSVPAWSQDLGGRGRNGLISSVFVAKTQIIAQFATASIFLSQGIILKYFSLAGFSK